MPDIAHLGIFTSNCDTIKNTSIDDNIKTDIEYMTESTLEVINFDKVKTDYVKDMNLCSIPKSCDALFIYSENEWYLIEFKNGTIDDLKNYEVKIKIYESLLILLDLINQSISFSRQHINFILVYNEQKIHTSHQFSNDEFNKINHSKSLITIQKYVFKLAKEPFVQFGLKHLQKLYFKTVNTYTKAQFESEFIQKLA